MSRQTQLLTIADLFKEGINISTSATLCKFLDVPAPFWKAAWHNLVILEAVLKEQSSS
ncbi:MAG: hypothetical protein AB7L09_25010 [Nitrospira sp.]